MEIWTHIWKTDDPEHFNSEFDSFEEVVSALIDERHNALYDGYKYTVHVTVSGDEQSCKSEIIDMTDVAQRIIDESEQDGRYYEAHRRSFSQPSSIQGW